MRINGALGDAMNIKLGAPYEAIMNRLIERGYAGSQTEVIRQALVTYERTIDEEEVFLVNKAVEMEMEKIRSGKERTFKAASVFREAGI